MTIFQLLQTHDGTIRTITVVKGVETYYHWQKRNLRSRLANPEEADVPSAHELSASCCSHPHWLEAQGKAQSQAPGRE